VETSRATLEMDENLTAAPRIVSESKYHVKIAALAAIVVSKYIALS
jgi:hypothetical protein